MSYFGGGGQSGGANRGGGGGNPTQQTTLLTGPQLFVNSGSQLQFQSGGQNFYPQGEGSQQQSHVQLNTGGAPLILQPPVNFVTDGLGVGISQLITQGSIMNLGVGSVLQMQDGAPAQGQGQSKQRVFTGMVTKIHDNFGFIDEEVFFQMGVVKGPVLPKEGDRVLVEADYNPSMPFKWNATRVQIVNMGGGGSNSVSQQQSGGYQGYSSAQKQVPPPPTLSSGGGGRPQQSVNMVSNPHSMYNTGGGSGRPNNHSHVSGGMSDPLMTRRPPQIPPHLQHQDSGMMSSGLMGGLPPLMSKMDSGRDRMDRERERDRKDKERVPRSRSKERGGRDRRERSRDRTVRRSRSKSRERRRRSPSPVKRRSRDRSDRSAAVSGRERSVDRERDRRERDRSPVTKPQKPDRVERVKRSRSRDTIKSSEGKSSSNRGKSRSVSPRRGGNTIKSGLIKAPSRYSCDPPKFSLDVLELNCTDLKSRYKNLYVPSDFFLAKSCWMEAFPLTKPFQLSLTSSLAHIMGRRVERLEVKLDGDSEATHQNFSDVSGVLHATDSSCTFSVKVMLLSSASLATIFRKSGFVLDTDNPETSEPNKDITVIGFQTLQRLLNFVVGVKTGKHDIMALGGNWSASLDGPDPQSNPKVLINTAIRCCKAMASLDLTRCKSWYRFMEIYYRRSNGNLETVVYFLPDLSACVPSVTEWDRITKAYRIALYGSDADKLAKVEPESTSNMNNTPNANCESISSQKKTGSSLPATADSNLDENWETSGGAVNQATVITSGGNTAGILLTPSANDSVPATDVKLTDDSSTSAPGENNSSERMEIGEECNNGDAAVEHHEVHAVPLINSKETADGEVDIYDDIVEINRNDAKNSPAGTHHSLLDLNCMTVAKLREELTLRNLNTKGLKAQLTSRLQEAIESEKQQETTVIDSSVPPVAKEIKMETVIETDASVTDIPTKLEKEEFGDLSMVRLVDTATLLETSINENDTMEEIQNDESNSQSTDQLLLEESRQDEIILDHIKSAKGILSYPVLRPETKPEERKLWERRFALPKSPRVLLFPATKVNSSSSSIKKSIGPFDCSVMPLCSLRDYRTMDKREESFEVSLFSEFFYEMLQRDFGFRIYSEIVRQTGLLKNSEKELQQNDVETGSKEEEPVTKKRKTSSVSGVPVGVINNVELKDKMKTVDPLLLLAFTFFDENQSGYISENHIEDICSALGLGLTRHEVQKLLRKVASKGYLNYRVWTDKTEAEIDGDTEQSLLVEESKFDPDFLCKMAKGNKTLLPVFTYSTPIVTFDDVKPGLCNEQGVDTEESVMITVDGHVVDVRQVKNQLEKAEKEKLSAEANVNAFRNSLTEAKNQVSELKKSNENLTDELKKTKDQVKKLEGNEKYNKEMLDTFKKSTENFIYRVKDIVKLPHSHNEEKKLSSIVTVPDKNKTPKQSTGDSSTRCDSRINDNSVDDKDK